MEAECVMRQLRHLKTAGRVKQVKILLQFTASDSGGTTSVVLCMEK
jgi:hypothetical protein